MAHWFGSWISFCTSSLALAGNAQRARQLTVINSRVVLMTSSSGAHRPASLWPRSARFFRLEDGPLFSSGSTQTHFVRLGPVVERRIRARIAPELSTRARRGYALPPRRATLMLNSLSASPRDRVGPPAQHCLLQRSNTAIQVLLPDEPSDLLPFKLVKCRRSVPRIELLEKGPVPGFGSAGLRCGFAHGATFADHPPNVCPEAFEVARHRTGCLRPRQGGRAMPRHNACGLTRGQRRRNPDPTVQAAVEGRNVT